MSENMMPRDWFIAGKNKKCCRFLFPLGMPPLWALFQAGFVFRNINYKLSLLSSRFLFQCLHQPTLAMVLSSPQLEHWSRTSVSLCGLDASHLPSLSAFSPAFYSLSSVFLGVEECSCRFTQRLGNTRSKFSLHDNTLQNIRTSSGRRKNQDHLVTRLGPARPKTLTLFFRGRRGRR